ncbi:hypothetical protein BASA50_000095 [Batrachochytrium salamandrivorans]|uniref:GPI-anchor transamidase n=1 Tax=Batrachochytrium salamandrivorans TaxID=1357716 RepID=A0ABQ8EVJ6_9FUNG|nr:hypothetical protein BASA60_000440 [Batrachochytrium salamandrivorans]KAH6560246.1 hypothetical protein BASA62_000215 [Batrachochytrium salamandrivorans]KAH6578880.1 hypothetical protein BASA61_000411 [Batrachochytrium salamandrivorans]KAH6587047.1 hypothetical protein BASA50_000095 [Batrachochytrium salamandrivorans]
MHLWLSQTSVSTYVAALGLSSCTLLALSAMLGTVGSVHATDPLSGAADPAVHHPHARPDSAPQSNHRNLSNFAFVDDTTDRDSLVDDFFSTSGHTNNWAVLVCTSRFWFNYRHIANTLSMYRTVKRLGIPDSNIILMLADDVACNSRNKFPATVYNNNRRLIDLYGSNVEVDYRGYDVTVENFIRLLTGRVEEHVPRSKRLLTDDRSNILVFLTGHGGEDFLKFQDAEELGAQDIADAFAQMYEKKRYHEIFFMIDTCQAASMYSRFYSPNILAAASSLTGESSYSHHVDHDLGVSVIDRFTYYNLETLEHLQREDQASLSKLFSTYNFAQMQSHVGIRQDLFKRPLDKTLVTDFFGGVQSVELTERSLTLSKRTGAPATQSDLHSNRDSSIQDKLVGLKANPKPLSGSSVPINRNNVLLAKEKSSIPVSRIAAATCILTLFILIFSKI